jgi:hypothetical protein
MDFFSNLFNSFQRKENLKTLDKEDFQAYCKNYSLSGIIPSNISIESLNDENNIMLESLLFILEEKDILSPENRSIIKINNDNEIGLDRQIVLQDRQRIEALFDYLKSKNIITHEDIKNSFKVVIDR